MCKCGGDCTSYDPWRHAGRLGVAVDWSADLPPTARGDYCRGVIRLNRRLLRVEARCTLAHELVHHERGDNGAWCSDWHRNRAEKLVHLTAARRLISLCELADAIAEHGDSGLNRPAVADQLQVDPRTLRLMLGNLRAAERAWVRRVVGALRG